MTDDPVISAVRATRHEMSASVDHDPEQLVDYYRQRQELHPERVVSRVSQTPVPDDETAA